jgi:hypothetical protein
MYVKSTYDVTCDCMLATVEFKGRQEDLTHETNNSARRI